MPASFMVLWRSDLLLLLPVIVKLLAGSTRWDYSVPGADQQTGAAAPDEQPVRLHGKSVSMRHIRLSDCRFGVVPTVVSAKIDSSQNVFHTF